jgi:hypothetical protein
MAQDGIADVIEVGHLAMVEQHDILELARVAHHAVVPHDHVFPEISVVPDLAVPSDDGRPLNHHAILHHGAFADINFGPDESPAFATIAQFRPDVAFQIITDSFQRLPGVFTTVEDRGVRRLLQVE